MFIWNIWSILFNHLQYYYLNSLNSYPLSHLSHCLSPSPRFEIYIPEKKKTSFPSFPSSLFLFRNKLFFKYVLLYYFTSLLIIIRRILKCKHNKNSRKKIYSIKKQHIKYLKYKQYKYATNKIISIIVFFKMNHRNIVHLFYLYIWVIFIYLLLGCCLYL